MNNKSITDSILIILIIIATMMVWGVMYFQLSFFVDITVPFWHFKSIPIKVPLFLLPIIILPVISYIVIKRARQLFFVLFVLILSGVSYQFSLNLLEGEWLSGLRSRITRAGHVDFISLATYQGNTFTLLKNYERLVMPHDQKEITQATRDALNRGDIDLTHFDLFNITFVGNWARSKPPGLALLYIASKKMSQSVLLAKSSNERRIRLLNFISVTWPFIAYLVLIPLFYFAKRISDTETAKIACLFYSVIPSVNLLILYTDQVFFPLFLMTLLGISSWVFCEKRSVFVMPVGVLTYLVLYCSFGLMFIVPFVLALLYTAAFEKPNGKIDSTFLLKSLVFYAMGFLLTDLLFRFTLNYDIFLRYSNAMKNHHWFNAWRWSITMVSQSGIANIVSYVALVGVPIMGLAFMNSLRHISTTLNQCLSLKWVSYRKLLPVLTLFIFLFLCFFSQTRSEAARLFLFLVPICCILAANEVKERFITKPWFVLLCIGLQVGTILFVRLYYDIH